ncbi:hypothetical protein B0182_01710 [Moraxella bovis]|nr:hypothetical protein DQF64_06815 [Moraxella bovis]OOR92180.1 hypothetical protein B0182_01710 [Moraxella bovis]
MPTIDNIFIKQDENLTMSINFCMKNSQILWLEDQSLFDKKLAACVFPLKNVRFPCFFKKAFSLQIPKAGMP